MAPALLALWWTFAIPSPDPHLAYTLRIDPAHLEQAQVEIAVTGATETVQLAMKVHGEYDARYWRFVDQFSVTGSANDRAAGVTRLDSTLWSVRLPGGHGVIRYRVTIQPPLANGRRAWMPHVRADGAFINPPDFFLYLPAHPGAPATVTLDVPAAWRVATALPSTSGAHQFRARDAFTLLDSPIMLGALREWSFTESGTRFHVVYWPLPDATTFDTVALVGNVRALARSALDLFGSAPTPEFYFLLQDGAGDALEHLASVTLGVPSSSLAREPRAYGELSTMAHEFFHTWNIVAIHPEGYNALSYRAPARTTGLWIGEGITLHYADVLPRRAGLVDSTQSRLIHLRNLLMRYHASPTTVRVSPERASLAFPDSPRTNPEAAASYYLQGELLANVIDAMVRDSTAGRRGIDDIMRALYAQSRAPGYRGYGARGFEATADSVCGCRLDGLFANVVRGSAPIDLTPVVARLGLQIAIDSAPAMDNVGQPAPDLRLNIDFNDPSAALLLIVNNPATVWARAGLQSGDLLLSLKGVAMRTSRDVQQALGGMRIGDQVPVEIRRGNNTMRVMVNVAGYQQPRVRFTDVPQVTSQQRALRAKWDKGEP